MIEYEYGRTLKTRPITNSSNSVLTQATKLYGYEKKEKMFLIDGFMRNPIYIFSNGKLQSIVKNR